MTRKPWADKGSRHSRGYGRRWEKVREQALTRDRHLCQPCKRAGRWTPATEVDHVIPKSKGGSDDLDGLQSICGPCHRDKTTREAAEAQGRTMKDRPRFDRNGRVEW